MATDGPTPPPCDPRIYTEGQTVFVGDTLGSNAMERWVQKIAKDSGQPVDWHWSGGRANVLALGDREAVTAALLKHRPEYDRLHAEAVAKLEHSLRKITKAR